MTNIVQSIASFLHRKSLSRSLETVNEGIATNLVENGAMDDSPPTYDDVQLEDKKELPNYQTAVRRE